MKNFFVIGDSTSQSLSPIIFNHWFKVYNIQAKYSFIEVNAIKLIVERIIIKAINETNRKTFSPLNLYESLSSYVASFKITSLYLFRSLCLNGFLFFSFIV